MYKGEGCTPCSKYTFHGWNVGIIWPFIVLPIVLATGYRAVQTVWVIFMHYTFKTMYIQCTCILLGKFILARPSRVKRSKGFALHSQPLSKSHQPNPQMNVSGRIVGIMISFLSWAAGATSLTWMTTDWSWSGCWTWSWIVFVRFAHVSPRGGFSLAAFHAPACHFLSLLHAMWCAWEHNDPKSQTIQMWAIGSHGCELVLAWLCVGVVLANFVLWPAPVAHAQVPSLVTSSWHRQHHAKSPVPAVIMKLLPFCQRLTKCAKRMQKRLWLDEFDWVLIFPNDRTNAKYMLNICFLCAAYICTGPRRQICEVYPLESQTPGAEFDSYEFQPFVALILFFTISRSILGACG